MDVLYLTVDHVIDLHAEAIDQFGGADGLRSQDLLESAVFQPQQSAFGEDAYPDVASKAAAYAYGLARNHAFVDGNKRTAAAAMLTFLYLNALELNRSDNEIEEALVCVSANEMSKEDFFRWVLAAVRPQIENANEE